MINTKWLTSSIVLLGLLMVLPLVLRTPYLQPSLSTEKRPDFKLKELDMTMYHNSAIEWRLHAKEADLYKSDAFTTVNHITAMISSATTQDALTLISPIAKLDHTHSFFEFQTVSGHYTLSQPSLSFTSPILFWNSHTQHLYGSQSIQLHNDRLSMSAESFSLNLSSKELILTRNILLTIKAPDV